MSPSSIPDRWIDYTPVGQKIEGTRFIAFKVPLKEYVAKNVDNDTRLDGDILLKLVPNLGVIIDLTNTNRYYDPQFFEYKGVLHKKLMIPGQQTPKNRLVKQFINIVKEFIKNNTDNDKLIGVHCTHGVNRTGYLICNYMISQMTIEPNEALNRFASARGHKIERRNYIDALHSLLPVRNGQRNDAHNCRERKETPEKDDVASKYRKRNQWSSRDCAGPYVDNNRDRYESSVQKPGSRSAFHFANNNRGNNFYSYRSQNNPKDDEPNNAMRYLTLGQDQLGMLNKVYKQPPRLRLDYYNARPVGNATNGPPRLKLNYYNARPANERKRGNHQNPSTDDL